MDEYACILMNILASLPQSKSLIYKPLGLRLVGAKLGWAIGHGYKGNT